MKWKYLQSLHGAKTYFNGTSMTMCSHPNEWEMQWNDNGRGKKVPIFPHIRPRNHSRKKRLAWVSEHISCHIGALKKEKKKGESRSLEAHVPWQHHWSHFRGTWKISRKIKSHFHHQSHNQYPVWEKRLLLHTLHRQTFPSTKNLLGLFLKKIQKAPGDVWFLLKSRSKNESKWRVTKQQVTDEKGKIWEKHYYFEQSSTAWLRHFIQITKYLKIKRC